MSDIRFLPLDGTDIIGGSKLLLEADGSRVLLDFGTNFHMINEYYEEFLQPRVACGLLDHVTMGLLPDARNLYREDLMHPELVLEGPDVGKIDAVLLSHAHVDHSGAIGFLKLDVPVVTSMMSAAIAKAMQDSMALRPGGDGVYATPRAVHDCRGSPVLTTDGDEMPGRDFCMTDGEPSKKFEEFWALNPPEALGTKKTKHLIPGRLLPVIPGIKYKAYPVDHSIKGASGFIISTCQGSVIYTGDLRLHGLEGDKTKAFVDAAVRSKPFTLITEGTTIGRSHEQVTEKEVSENIGRIVADAKGKLVTADFGPRNIERLEIVLKIAKENGRRLVVAPKDAYLLQAMNLADKDTPMPGDDMSIYDCPREKRHKWEEWTFDVRFQRTAVKPDAIRDAPGDYLLAFSFFDIKHLVDLKPEGGHYIYSSSEAHSEEQKIDFIRLGNWLRKFGIQHHGFGFDKEGNPTFTKGLHASGHASEDDLREIISKMEPEVLIPVHTERFDWFEDMFGGDCKVMRSTRCEWMTL